MLIIFENTVLSLLVIWHSNFMTVSMNWYTEESLYSGLYLSILSSDVDYKSVFLLNASLKQYVMPELYCPGNWNSFYVYLINCIWVSVKSGTSYLVATRTLSCFQLKDFSKSKRGIVNWTTLKSRVIDFIVSDYVCSSILNRLCCMVWDTALYTITNFSIWLLLSNFPKKSFKGNFVFISTSRS